MSGERLTRELDALASNFDEVAVPEHGRYVNAPARFDESGVTYTPPPVADPLPKILAAGTLAAGIGLAGRDALARPAAMNAPCKDRGRKAPPHSSLSGVISPMPSGFSVSLRTLKPVNWPVAPGAANCM